MCLPASKDGKLKGSTKKQQAADSESDSSDSEEDDKQKKSTSRKTVSKKKKKETKQKHSESEDSDDDQEEEHKTKSNGDEKEEAESDEKDDQTEEISSKKKDKKAKNKANKKEKKSSSKGGDKDTESDVPSKSQSFWARWGNKSSASDNSASLQTGRGNKAVSRSLRDAREDAVCLVRSGKKAGSGFLVEFKGHVGMLTNNHVIPSKKEARGATATFNTATKGSVEVQLLPKEAFYSSMPEVLDYSFIACEHPAGVVPIPLAMRRADTEDDSSDGLVCIEDMAVKAGDTVTIVQHPDAGEKSIAIGPILKVQGTSVSYEADTEMGSSGSPVLKDYIPVALHHRAPRDGDSRGNGLLGSISCAPVRKHTNKGVLLSAILADLDTKMPAKGESEGAGDDDKKAGSIAASGTSASRSLFDMMGLAGLACGASRKGEKDAKDEGVKDKKKREGKDGDEEDEGEEQEQEEESEAEEDKQAR
jgi:hypothetical protein